jgi:hypothetical protein
MEGAKSNLLASKSKYDWLLLLIVTTFLLRQILYQNILTYVFFRKKNFFLGVKNI